MILLALAALTPDWTPHTAAELLDDRFPSHAACEAALAAARARPSTAAPVHGLSYDRLFAQGRCRPFVHDGRTAWRVRMQWQGRTAAAGAQPSPR